MTCPTGFCYVIARQRIAQAPHHHDLATLQAGMNGVHDYILWFSLVGRFQPATHTAHRALRNLGLKHIGWSGQTATDIPPTRVFPSATRNAWVLDESTRRIDENDSKLPRSALDHLSLNRLTCPGTPHSSASQQVPAPFPPAH